MQRFLFFFLYCFNKTNLITYPFKDFDQLASQAETKHEKLNMESLAKEIN